MLFWLWWSSFVFPAVVLANFRYMWDQCQVVFNFFLFTCSWCFCNIKWDSWEWCFESIVSNHWPRFRDGHCLMWFCERSRHQWGFGRGHLKQRCEVFCDLNEKHKVLTKIYWFSVSGFISVRAHYTSMSNQGHGKWPSHHCLIKNSHMFGMVDLIFLVRIYVNILHSPFSLSYFFKK